MYYANRQGQAIALTRLAQEQAELRLKTDEKKHRDYWQLSAIHAKPKLLTSEPNLFEPRERPWFLQAKYAKGHQWTPVYIDFTGQQLVMTRARQVLNAKGEFVGVVATDVYLNALQEFMRTLPLSEGSRALIVQKDGTLIAASDRPTLQQDANQQLGLTHIVQTYDPLLEAIYRQLQNNRYDHSTLKDHNNHNYEVAYRTITDEAGLEWVAIVVVPHKVMLAGIRMHVVLVVAIGLLVLGIALALGLRIFGGVANDMRTLTQAVRKVGDGDINTPIKVTRNDEIGELAQNFHSMRHSLFTDALTGSANRSALMHILNTLTVKAPTPFALLFVDLNRFKPLNDCYGHDNGDLALIEVAERIRAQLRSDDVLARLGGDEFVLVLMGVTTDQHVQVVREAIEKSLAQDLTSLTGNAVGQSVNVGAAIGQALYPRDGSDAQSLLQAADQDMYRRKKASTKTARHSEHFA